MPRIKLHYDGWMALPTDVRQRFGVTTGDQLEAEWVDGGLILRAKSAVQKEAQAEPPTLEPEKAPAKMTAKRTTKPKAPRSRGSGSAKRAGALLPKTAGRKAVTKKAGG